MQELSFQSEPLTEERVPDGHFRSLMAGRPQVKGAIFGVRRRELIVLWRLWYTGTSGPVRISNIRFISVWSGLFS